jgi:hypothetical protein
VCREANAPPRYTVCPSPSPTDDRTTSPLASLCRAEEGDGGGRSPRPPEVARLTMTSRRLRENGSCLHGVGRLQACRRGEEGGRRANGRPRQRSAGLRNRRGPASLEQAGAQAGRQRRCARCCGPGIPVAANGRGGRAARGMVCSAWRVVASSCADCNGAPLNDLRDAFDGAVVSCLPINLDGAERWPVAAMFAALPAARCLLPAAVARCPSARASQENQTGFVFGAWSGLTVKRLALNRGLPGSRRIAPAGKNSLELGQCSAQHDGSYFCC